MSWNITNEYEESNLTKISSNSTYISSFSVKDIRITILAILLVIIIIPNFFLLVILIRSSLVRPLSRTYLFMLHLSIADILVGFFSVFSQLMWFVTRTFKGSNFVCKTIKWAQMLPMYLSSLLVMFMAVDRYIAFSKNHSFQFFSSKKIIKSMVSLSWILSSILALPQTFFFKMQLNSYNEMDCWVVFSSAQQEKMYILYYTFFAFFIPFIVIVSSFALIFHKIWRYSRTGEEENTDILTRFLRNICCTKPEIHNNSTSLDQDTSLSIQHRYELRVNLNSNMSPEANHSISVAKTKTIQFSLTIALAFIVCHIPFIGSKLHYVIYDTSGNTHLSVSYFILNYHSSMICVIKVALPPFEFNLHGSYAICLAHCY